jgi:hypothetical protein
MLYIILRGCLYDIIVLNVHAANGDKSDDTKNRFYEEAECKVHENFEDFNVPYPNIHKYTQLSPDGKT